MEGPGSEEFFNSGKAILEMTFNMREMKGADNKVISSIGDLTGSPVAKDVLSRLLESMDDGDRQKAEKELLSADNCQWRFGPCGSCYNTSTRYAYAYNCGQGWVYGCGYCT